MIRKLLVLGLASVFAGCAHTVQLTQPFNESQAKALLAPGVNTIQGSAVIRQNGGGVVTCAGLQVTLIPATDYASERLAAFYGNSMRAYQSVGWGRRVGSYQPDHPGYTKYMRNTICSGSGSFTFDRVADGEFLVVTAIIWNVGGAQGGYLLQRVSVHGGEIKEIVLSP